MKLTELQGELRSIGKKVSELEAAIEQMKPKTEDEKEKEYKAITNIARKCPLMRPKLEAAGESVWNMYLKVLMSMAFFEEDCLKERLLYITRIAMGLDERKYTAEQIMKLGAQFNAADMSGLCNDMEPIKGSFLADSFAVANICGTASGKSMVMLAELATVFGCDENDVEVLSTISKAMLTCKFEYLSTLKSAVSYKWYGQFSQIIPEEWLAKHRRYCGRYCIENENIPYLSTPICQVKSRLVQGSFVKKGMEIVSYVEKRDDQSMFKIERNVLGDTVEQMEGRKDEKKILASTDGIVYFIEDDIKDEESEMVERFVLVYVVSGFDDYTAFSAWYKKLEQKDNRHDMRGIFEDLFADRSN